MDHMLHRPGNKIPVGDMLSGSDAHKGEAGDAKTGIQAP